MQKLALERIPPPLPMPVLSWQLQIMSCSGGGGASKRIVKCVFANEPSACMHVYMKKDVPGFFLFNHVHCCTKSND